MTKEKLLAERKARKKSKPNFVVKESHYQARVKKRWRFPRGRHSQVRQMHKGKPAMPNPGYGSPKQVHGLHHSGLEPRLVYTKDNLLSLNDGQGALIARNLGNKRRLELLKLAEEKKISVLNVKDVAKLIAKINEEFAARKNIKSNKQKDKSKKQEEKQKSAEKKKKEEEKTEKTKNVPIEEKLQEEEKKQKKVAEKTLTKRQ